MYISIKNRLTFLLIIFTLLPFVLLRLVAYPRIQADLQEVMIRDLDGIGHKQAELVTHWMGERLKNVRAVANNSYASKWVKMKKDDKEYQEVVQYFESLKVEYGYKGVFVSNDKGIITVATADEELGGDISQAEYFKQAMQGNASTSSVMHSEIPLANEFGEKEMGLPTLFVSSPLKDKDGATIGVLALRIDVNTLSEIVSGYMMGKTCESYLVNKDGFMITESRFA
ncbi:MAG: cache domain-containing protein, partial [Planctomycetota bacterium]